MKLSEMREQLPPTPPGTLMVPPDVWATTYERRPLEPVLFGLRLLSPYDKREIIKLAKEAAEEADEVESAVDVYDDALMRLLVAFAVCDPNDANSQNHSTIPHPQLESVFSVFTDKGARFVFDAVQRLEVEKSPYYLEADDDDIIELVESLGAGGLDMLSERDLAAARRHLRYVLDIVREAEAETEAA